MEKNAKILLFAKFENKVACKTQMDDCQRRRKNKMN